MSNFDLNSNSSTPQSGNNSITNWRTNASSQSVDNNNKHYAKCKPFSSLFGRGFRFAISLSSRRHLRFINNNKIYTYSSIFDEYTEQRQSSPIYGTKSSSIAYEESTQTYYISTNESMLTTIKNGRQESNFVEGGTMKECILFPYNGKLHVVGGRKKSSHYIFTKENFRSNKLMLQHRFNDMFNDWRHMAVAVCVASDKLNIYFLGGSSGNQAQCL